MTDYNSVKITTFSNTNQPNIPSATVAPNGSYLIAKFNTLIDALIVDLADLATDINTTTENLDALDLPGIITQITTLAGQVSTLQNQPSAAPSQGIPTDTHPEYLEVYVNQSTGNDTGGDGSSAAPYQTLAKAIEFVSSKKLTNNSWIYANGSFTEDLDFSRIYSNYSGGLFPRTLQVRSYSGGTLQLSIDRNDQIRPIRDKGLTLHLQADSWTINESWVISDSNSLILSGLFTVGTSLSQNSAIVAKNASITLQSVTCNMNGNNFSFIQLDNSYLHLKSGNNLSNFSGSQPIFYATNQSRIKHQSLVGGANNNKALLIDNASILGGFGSFSSGTITIDATTQAYKVETDDPYPLAPAA